MRILQRSAPVCIRGSPYAYGDPHMQNYEYGDTKLNFPYVHSSLCIRGMTEKSPYAYRDAKIPVCIRGLVSIRSPYAYRDCENPRMHTGITYWSQYAYGDYMTCNPCMHMGIDLDLHMHTGIWLIPVCMGGLILIPICIRGLHVM